VGLINDTEQGDLLRIGYFQEFVAYVRKTYFKHSPDSLEL